MKTRKDYSKSQAPRFDALQDVINFLGDRWPKCNDHLKLITSVDQFENWAGFAGVEGAPVEAWYDHIHGEGAWVVAGGTSQFSDGMAIKPMTIRRAYTRDLIENLNNVLSIIVEQPHIGQDHPLTNLAKDDFAFVEEWLQDMLESVEEQDSAEDEVLLQGFIRQIEDKLIQKMLDKIDEQIRAIAQNKLTLGFVLHGMQPESLVGVSRFIHSFKNRSEG